MKKIVATLLAVVMLIGLLPSTVWAFDSYTVYRGQNGCQLTSLTFPKSLNAWLAWDVEFTALCDGRVLENAKIHPLLVGAELIPQFAFEGDSVTFNGTEITSGETAVTLKKENELIVYGNNTRAEYQISIVDENNGIPVVLIDTENAPIPDKINYVPTEISVLGADIYGGKDIIAATGGIKLRGNSTSLYDKKPYRIKFDSKQNVFGLGKAKSWVLLANFLDPASIRNDVAYSFGARLSAFTAETTGFQVYVPRMRPVEVYLNGTYLGLYDMGDHVQVDDTRIAIDESGDEFDDNDVQLYPEGNVGYYLEIEDSSRVLAEYESEGAAYFVIENTGGYSKQELYVQVKTPEIPSKEQLNYIETYLQTVNDLIRAQDERVWDYIDMDGFIDWYLINETFKNTDSNFLSSVKLFKDKDGKLFMGPAWDFDLGSGAVAYSKIDDPTGWRTRETERADWYENLFEMDSFVTAVEKRWADLHDRGILEKIFEDIDRLVPYLEDAANDNFALWHDNYDSAVANTSWLSVPAIQLGETSWLAQTQYLKNYMKGRIAWMDEQFGYATASGKTISGEVEILGAPEYRATLTAGTFTVKPYAATLSYQWYADGKAISGATKSTYTPAVSYIGSQITVKVTATGSYRGSLTSEPITLEYTTKTTATSQVPPLVSFTHDTVVVSERTGYDISIDGGETWQESGTFTGLTPNTFYRVVYRHKNGIDYHKPGLAGKPTYVITAVDPNAPPVVEPPVEPPVDPDEPTYDIGDVTMDGAVNTTDCREVLKYTIDPNVLTEEQLTYADYNHDGTVSTVDARQIILSLLG
ncbi:MAG: CotH kinase family protein [Clostridia bacterium]|nr:CotH kinase family protein [Clostridia bacterium]